VCGLVNMAKDSLSDKSILIITPCFPDENSRIIQGTFVKDQVDAIKDKVKHVYVIAPVLNTLKLTLKVQMKMVESFKVHLSKTKLMQ